MFSFLPNRGHRTMSRDYPHLIRQYKQLIPDSLQQLSGIAPRQISTSDTSRK